MRTIEELHRYQRNALRNAMVYTPENEVDRTHFLASLAMLADVSLNSVEAMYHEQAELHAATGN